MTFPRARLTVAACLLFAWLGYLLYLVIISRDTLVLSRPQLISADVVIRAAVRDRDGKPAPTVKVLEFLRRNRLVDLKLVGQDVEVVNLPDAADQGYTGPGEYVLPLDDMPGGPQGPPLFKLHQVPANPGFEPAFVKVQMWSVGRAPDQAAELAVEALGADALTVKTKLDKLASKQAPAIIVASGVRREAAINFLRKLRDADPGADAALVGDDIRIYPWTPQTQQQIEALTR